MTLASVLRRVRSLFLRSRLDAELREEIATHVEARREALIADGMDPADAARQARRQFGNVTSVVEQARDARGFPWLESVAQDIRYGARLLARAPLFTLVAVLSIAFGLAAGLGVFTVANAIILRPIVGGGDDIYRVYTSGREGSRFNSSSYADYRDFTQARGFSRWCVSDQVRVNITTGVSSSAQEGSVVTGGCFTMLGLRPHIGRFFDSSNAAEAVISFALWTRQFGANPSIVGTNVLVNGRPATIVGVAPIGFNGTSLDKPADFWVPIERFAPHLLSPRALEDRRNRAFTVYARLQDGVSSAQAEAELSGIGVSLHRQDPAAWTDGRGAARRVTVMKEVDARFATEPGLVPAMLGSVIAAIAAIVAIACVNLATMLLARGAARTRELTIRLAIGASRARLLRQLATESLLIAVLGTGLALAAIAAAIRIFEARRPEGVPAVNLAIDWRVVLFSTGVALFATVLFGLLPALHVVRLAIVEGMKGRVSTIRSRWMRAGAREALIVVQVAASVALLVVAALFGRGLAAGAAASPGFTTEGIASIGVDLGMASGPDAPAIVQRLVEAVGSVANVDRPTLAGIVPLTGTATGFLIGEPGAQREVDGNVVSPGYFATLGIPLRYGRDFTEQDKTGRVLVGIVSETLARTRWQTTNVVGRTLPLGERSTIEIVGVVGDIRYRTVTGPYPPLLYLPIAQPQRDRFVIHARVRGGGETLAAMEAAARSVDPRVIIDRAVPLAHRLNEVRGPEQFAGWIGGAVGIAQFALVLMALWALVAYAVERRTQEIGIRLALGATRPGVMTMLLRPALLLIAIGSIVGSAAGIAAATIFQSEFIWLGPLEPAAGIPAILTMGLVAAVAAFVPARRATRVDPMVALRAE